MSERSPFLALGQFVGSMTTRASASVVLMGAPMDTTVTLFPGSRFGPSSVRQASQGIETYSPELDRDLADVGFYDAGDIELPFGNTAGSLEAIESAVRGVIEEGKLPLTVGGEHLITLPCVRALAARYRDLVVLQFDAHTDLRSEYYGEEDSHATVMRRIADMIGPDRLYQFGIRSGEREEFEYGRRHTHFFPFEVLPALKRSLPMLAGRPVYVTIDIDVIDPAHAPGTGTPEAGGCTARELFEAIHALDGLNVVGCDVVELCPPAEHGMVTSLLVAKIIRELILTFGWDRDRR